MKGLLPRAINDLSVLVGLSTLTPHQGVKFQSRYWVGIYKYLLYNSQRQHSCPLGVLMKGITRLFNWFKWDSPPPVHSSESNVNFNIRGGLH